MHDPIGHLLHPAAWAWGSVADWLLLVTAIVGSVLALRQLAKASEANRDNWRIQQGVQLMQIDDKYEVTLQESRKAITRLQRQLQADLGEGQETLLPARMSAVLTGLVATSRKAGSSNPVDRAEGEAAIDRYFVLMQLPTYIETIGVLVEDGLVGETAILKLYDAMIERVIGNIKPHLVTRRHHNPDFLCYAERLHDHAAARMDNARRARARHIAAIAPNP